MKNILGVLIPWAGPALLVGMMGLGSCSALRSDPAACPRADLAKLEAEYVAEAIASCKLEGAHSAAECKALPAIKAKYEAKRKAWVECAPEGAGGGK